MCNNLVIHWEFFLLSERIFCFSNFIDENEYNVKASSGVKDVLRLI